MDTEKFRNIVQHRLSAVGGTPIGVARRAGLPRDAIRSVFRGHPPNLERLAEICEALDLELYIGPARRFSDLDSRPLNPKADPFDGAAETEPPYGAALPLSRLIDLETHVQGLVRIVMEAGGDPVSPDSFQRLLLPMGHESLRALRIAVVQAEGLDLTVVDMVGNSMKPTLYDGDWALVDRSQRQLRHGGIFALNSEPLPLLRRIRETADGWWGDSDNNDDEKNQHPPLAISGSDEVIGRVVWWSSTGPRERAIAGKR